MTKSPLRDEGRPCRWCGRPVGPQAGVGRIRLYCRATCRQRDFEARQRAIDVGLTESELIVTRQALEELHDALYVLEAAVEDVDRDLQSAKTTKDYREALEWVLQAARPLTSKRLT